MATIDVLWTSGWDSTFRVLDASVTKGLAVRPHYLIDRGRASHAVEVMTIILLTQDIRARWPAAEIAPPLLTDRDAIPPHPEVEAAFWRLRKILPLGRQNSWLAQYVLWRGIEGLELCIHQGDRAQQLVAPLARRVATEGDTFHVVPPGEGDAERIFSNFRYPVLELSKLEMQAEARRRGFLEIMERTWFCHRPTASGEPCGVCNPCHYTIEEGLSRRLPAAAMRRHRHRHRLINRVWHRGAVAARRIADSLGMP